MEPTEKLFLFSPDALGRHGGLARRQIEEDHLVRTGCSVDRADEQRGVIIDERHTLRVRPGRDR